MVSLSKYDLMDLFRNGQLRGFRFTISNEMLTDILCEKLGLDPDKFLVKRIADAFYHEAHEIGFYTSDERFPHVVEGQTLEFVYPVVTRHEDGTWEIEWTMTQEASE
jgi:hypothetical protein